MEQNFLYSWFGSNIWTYLGATVLPLGFLTAYALVAILAEMKIASWVQDRLGPMRTGTWGIIQPVADVLKLMQKEDITPDAADKPLFNLAPYIVFVG